MKPYDFDYVRVTSLPEVFDVLEEFGEDAKILAGGQSLLATLNMRLSAPSVLIDVNDLHEIEGITVADGAVRIGALTRHAEIARSAEIRTHVPLLAQAIAHVAHPAIRNRGTIGGSIAFADPAAELPACAVALDAKLTLAGRDGTRTVRARDFFLDLYETALQDGEIIQFIDVPAAGADEASAFREFARRRGDFAALGLALHVRYDGDAFERVSPVFFGAANTPVLARTVAASLEGRAVSEVRADEVARELAADLEPIGDPYASARMKGHLAKVFLKDVLTEVCRRDG